MGYREEYDLWSSDDFFDLSTRTELKALTDEKEIEDRFTGNLELGPCGIKGLMGAGTARVNKYTAGRMACGLGRCLVDKYGDDAKKRGVVIGFDTRSNSKSLASAVAEVLASQGVKVYLHSMVCPISQLTYTIRLWKAVCGVMITALDAPKEYNGIIFYDGNGALLSSDVVEELSGYVDAVADYKAISFKGDQKLILKGDVADNYINFVRKQAKLDDPDLKRKLKIVYTPLHGSGNVTVTTSLMLEGFTSLTHVNDQVKQDGDFPTLGSLSMDDSSILDMAIAQGKREDADIVIASSPACDRVAVAVRRGDEFVRLGDSEVDEKLAGYAAGEEGVYKEDAIIRSLLICEMVAAEA